MRIRVHPSRRRIDRITLSMASMIDIVFLLLIYFLITAVLTHPEDRLTPNLQTKQDKTSGSMSDFQSQLVEVLRVSDQPTYRIGSREMTERAALREALSGLPKGEGLFVRVADRIPVEFAMAAIQVAHDVGFEQVTYVPAD